MEDTKNTNEEINNSNSENSETPTESTEELKKELEELKDKHINETISKLGIDQNYIELIEVDKSKSIEEIDKDIQAFIDKFPKFKKDAPVTGGVVKSVKNVPNNKPQPKNSKEPERYDGFTPTSVKSKLRELGE